MHKTTSIIITIGHKKRKDNVEKSHNAVRKRNRRVKRPIPIVYSKKSNTNEQMGCPVL